LDIEEQANFVFEEEIFRLGIANLFWTKKLSYVFNNFDFNIMLHPEFTTFYVLKLLIILKITA